MLASVAFVCVVLSAGCTDGSSGQRGPSGGTGGSAAGGATSSGGTNGVTGGTNASGGAVATGAASASGGAGAATEGSTGSEGTPEVRFTGRMDFRDPAKPTYAWSGSGMIARFHGTSVAVQLSGRQQYTVVLDGVVQPKLSALNGANAIAQGLTAGTHTIELYRRTEASEGLAQFLGFDFGDGELLPPPPPAARRLEIVGDSITCGYGIEGADQNCGFTPDTENHYLTYGAIAARDLGAELITIAWSGKGVVCNYGDEENSCTNPLPTYYDRILPDRPSSQWDFSSFQPDAVVINLGTNDFSTSEDPTQAEFESAYAAFLKHIREKYPNAYLLCTNGPMLTGADLDLVRSYLGNVVQALRASGDNNVTSFELVPQDSADGYGCDWHPSPVTHQKMADQLKAALKSALGW